MRYLYRLVALSMVFTSTAYADGMPESYTAPVALKPYNWSGAYLGINGGWAQADYDHTFHTSGEYNNVPGDVFDFRGDGGLIGGHIGYNWQMGQWVVGVEGGLAKTELSGTEFGSPFFDEDSWESDVEWIGSVTPRVGLVVGNNLLAYVKGGWAFGRVRDHVNDGADFVLDKDTRSGWTIGGGFDYMIAPNWVAGVEYDYYDLGSHRIDKEATDIGGGPCGCFTDHDFDVTLHAVTARLSYKFGSRPEPVPLK